MHRQYLLNLLREYAAENAAEEAMRLRMVQFIQNHTDCFERSLVPGHITGSAWMVNPARTHVFMLHHAKLNRWLQPGGHSDGNPDTLQVALRESHEESGIPLQAIQAVLTGIFDVDIHTIPARKSEAEHEHFDVRFLLEADDRIPLIDSEESNEIAWIPLNEIKEKNNEESVLRMLRKMQSL